MSKVFTFVVILASILLVTAILGVPTMSSNLINQFGYRIVNSSNGTVSNISVENATLPVSEITSYVINPSSGLSLSGANLLFLALGAIGLLGLTSVGIGALTGSSIVPISKALFTFLAATWISVDVGSIILLSFQGEYGMITGWLVSIILVPLMIGMWFGIFEWWGGSSS